MEAVDLTRRLALMFAPTDARSTVSRDALIVLLDAVDNPFGRDAQPDHVTASAVVVSDAGVLLHLHKKLQRWIGPGGHVDAGESPVDAVFA